MAGGADPRIVSEDLAGQVGVELLPRRFEHWVARTPAAVAVSCGAERLSYAELNERANRIAHALLEGGGVAGASTPRVAVMLDPSVDLVAALLGIAKAGAAWVPLDPAYPDERLRAISRQVQPDAIVSSAALQSRAADHAGLSILAAELAAVSSVATANPAQSLQPDSLAYLMFTSGSSGAPKGVEVSHGNIAGLFEAVQSELGFVPGDRWSSMHSFAFGFSVWEIWGALTTGAELCIVPGAMRGDPQQWARLVVEREVSVLSITPSAFRQWLLSDQLPTAEELAALKLIVFSGEAVRSDDLDQWFGRYGEGGPRLVNTYALTETAGRVTTCLYEPGAVPESGDIGRPAPDAEIFLLDPDTGLEVGPGETGELYIGGPMVAQGYLHDPELTAARFVTIDPGDGVFRRCYRTGDRATRGAAGELRFVGRADDQVKLRGYRIELQDIENVLRRHSQVADVAVVLTDGPAPQLVAWVQPAAGDEALEFWPSLGEYQVYDDLLYDFMSADEVRVASYARAFAAEVQGKAVLDIGTGKDAVLARLCAAAGARKVYAVEVLEDAARKARRLIEELGLADRIEVIQGDMQSIALPEAIDVCTQGIVGNIGSSDGIAPIWNAARPFFADNCVAIPSRCETLIAPAQLPKGARSDAAFGSLAAQYVEQIFREHGRPFDVRLCVRNFPREGVLATPAVFEDLDFSGELPTAYTGERHFVVERDGCFDGFLLWTRIRNGAEETVDFLDHQQAWLPVWFPVADEPLSVAQGQTIEARWWCETPAEQIFPDYRIEVRIGSRAQNESIEEEGIEKVQPLVLCYESRHFESAFCQTALHRSLHAARAETETDQARAQLRAWAAGQLPPQMLPARWEFIARLPLNRSGKLDRRALIVKSESQAERNASVDTQLLSPFQRDIAAIWCKVLGLESISPQQDFFEAGGDSILAVRLTTEVQRYLDDTVFLAALFDAPTVESYAVWLEEHHPAALSRRQHNDADDRSKTAGQDDGPAAGDPNYEVASSEAGNAIHGQLAPLQHSLWLMQQLYSKNTGANEQFLVRVLGRANPERLRSAWHAVVGQHAILRACYSGVAGVPRQAIAALEDCVATDGAALVDLAGMDAAAADQRLRSDAATAIGEPFDLAMAPLWRVSLYAMPGDATVLLITVHHIIADGLCVELIRDAIARAYVNPDQPAPRYQYADFVAAQSRQLAGPQAGRELDWWRARLAGHDGRPAAGIGESVQAQAPEKRFAFEIPADLADKLRALADAEATTLFTVLVAAWRIWLQRCLQNDDLLIGTPVTLRRDEATAEMLGCMVNNIVLRNPVDGEQSFAEVLVAERDGALTALDNSTVPFDRVLEAVDPQRFPGRHPLFQLMFQFADRSAPPVEAAGLSFAVDVLPVDRSSYWDLELSVSDFGRGSPLGAFLGVRTDLFDAEALSTWTDGLVAMLAALVAQPRTPVKVLPLLSEAQERRMLRDWNSLSLPIGSEQTLHGLFAEQADRTPGAPAVTDGEGTLSYAELGARAAQYASALASLGVAPGDRVGVCMDRGADCIALLLAVLKRGAAWLPLDPAYPGDRLAQLVADATPALLVTDGRAVLPPVRTVNLDELRAAGNSLGIAEDAVVRSVDAAFLLFTSGSTGRPKGVVAKHAGAVSRCLWMWQAYDFSSSDVFAQRTSLNFVDSVWEIFGALIHGARVAVLPARYEPDPDGMTGWFVEQKITHLVAVPALLRALLDADQSKLLARRLRAVISSGESLPPALVRRFRSSWPQARLLNTYGTSETWDASCYQVLQDSEYGFGGVPVGKPVANARVYVLDRNCEPLPCGAVGELYVGGMAVADGYIKDPELTRRKFVSNPFSEDASLIYATGDRARFLRDGTVVLEGRADRQIKLRGLRVEVG
ncbi:MAG: amino acid adenylation domain-containing protein, partial [Gammaproteobacteria bacterium]